MSSDVEQSSASTFLPCDVPKDVTTNIWVCVLVRLVKNPLPGKSDSESDVIKRVRYRKTCVKHVTN